MKKILIMVMLGCAVGAFAEEELDRTKEALSKWVETRKLISEKREGWKVEREILSDRMELIRTERDELSEGIRTKQAEITEADQKREDRINENDALKNASATLGNRIYTLEREVLALLPYLPEPVLERIRATTQSIPKTDESELSLSVRYQNLLYILIQLDKAANEILVVGDVRELANGTQAEGQTIYVGFACAYWCSNSGKEALVGTPTAEGWTWESNNEIASRVLDSISILKNEKVAEFIPLPVTVN